MNQPPSIWLRPERSARGPVPEHSRAEIARAAVALADQGGLAAVTMRSVAAAIGTGPASLYRYVNTRDEILELMVDEVAGEYHPILPAAAAPPSAPQPQPALAGLLQLARRARQIFRRHPWMIDLPSVGTLPGPNAIAYTERVLTVLDGTALDSTARLELVGIFTGLVRLLARTEADQRRAGQQLAQWQEALAAYLTAAVADGRSPRLAATLASAAGPSGPDDPFDRTLTRILAGLLDPPGSQLPEGIA
ncbi:MAG TPA: TetR/AcrR family transcriptional regulator [Streptosporangiaceae bacterium]|jgi:AcrR family transcriptional regulator|nr:TetR/AcrR family transcriptional regulator [Streptosporangiaceae bacterium]